MSSSVVQPVAALLAAELEVRVEHIAELISNPQDGVQRVHRALKDD